MSRAADRSKRRDDTRRRWVLAATAAVVDVERAAEVIGEPGVVVLDVRTPEEFATGHVPQARNVDLAGPDFAGRIGALDRSTTYVVYCRTGNRSATAVAQMAELDFEEVYDVEVGIVAWTAAGLPVER